MKTIAIVFGTITLAVVLVVAGFAAGALWGPSRWGVETRAAESGERMGLGMMGDGWGDRAYGPVEDVPCEEVCVIPSEGGASSLERVEAAVHDYVAGLGYRGLAVAEIMEFDLNYYAIVAEEDTGIGAMELLVDKESGVVEPEPGPNMMWNAEYGMHGRGGGMIGGYATGDMTLSPEQAEGVAQRWLDANLPGREAGEADAFYGYYTLHFVKDGQIEGMLSVHGSSGEVWYHSWHGDFVAMSEGQS
jgi:hypothetical protein